MGVACLSSCAGVRGFLKLAQVRWFRFNLSSIVRVPMGGSDTEYAVSRIGTNFRSS